LYRKRIVDTATALQADASSTPPADPPASSQAPGPASAAGPAASARMAPEVTVPVLLKQYFALEREQFACEMMLDHCQRRYRVGDEFGSDCRLFTAVTDSIQTACDVRRRDIEAAYTALEARATDLSSHLRSCCWFSLLAPFQREWSLTRLIVRAMLFS